MSPTEVSLYVYRGRALIGLGKKGLANADFKAAFGLFLLNSISIPHSEIRPCFLTELRNAS